MNAGSVVGFWSRKRLLSTTASCDAMSRVHARRECVAQGVAGGPDLGQRVARRPVADGGVLDQDDVPRGGRGGGDRARAPRRPRVTPGCAARARRPAPSRARAPGRPAWAPRPRGSCAGRRSSRPSLLVPRPEDRARPRRGHEAPHEHHRRAEQEHGQHHRGHERIERHHDDGRRDRRLAAWPSAWRTAASSQASTIPSRIPAAQAHDQQRGALERQPAEQLPWGETQRLEQGELAQPFLRRHGGRDEEPDRGEHERRDGPEPQDPDDAEPQRVAGEVGLEAGAVRR